MFPFFDFVETESLKQLDLSQPWDSASNREVADKVPQRDWNEFARDVIPPEQHPVTTHILALLGKDSIWDAKSGLPKGTRKEFPDAILLISVPESNIEPLEPRDIPEAEVCALVKDGKEVLFIRADDRYRCGVVKVEDGRLVFRDWKEPDD